MTIRHIKRYAINCTGDICRGDEILFTEAVFGGSHRRPVMLGTRRIAATVVRDSYGAAKQQHTFTLLVAGSDGYDAPRRATTIRRKGRNIYRNGVLRCERLNAERMMALDDKHTRGNSARARREMRVNEYEGR